MKKIQLLQWKMLAVSTDHTVEKYLHHLDEAFLLFSLRRFSFKVREQATFGNTGTRVRQLIQVCLDLDDPKTKSREVRALLKASVELKCKDLLILTDSTEGHETTPWFGAEGTIHYLPVWKWLQRNIDRGLL